MITQARLKELLHYDPESGIFTWLKAVSNALDILKPAGHLNNCGYIIIAIDRRKYVAHKLAWLYMTGHLPDHVIDHINNNRADNKWSNLREATRQQNQWNRPVGINNATGLKGAYKFKNKFKSYIGLGTFDTAIEAANAYKEAAIKLHGEFLHKSLKD